MYSKKIFFVLWMSIAMLGCEATTSFEEFQNNPNETTTATPGLLLTSLEISTFNAIDLSAAFASRHVVDVNMSQDAQYYRWDRYGFGMYNNLRQTVKMREEADRRGNTTMSAISEFIQVYIFHQLTRRFGDIPYVEALRAEEEVYRPAYTPQAEIYADMLTRLEKINADLATSEEAITGDIIFGGNRTRWQKLNNSLRLRILISLSEKENISIDYANQFRQIINNPEAYPIMESLDDNLQYTYSQQTGNTYPFFDNPSFETWALEETVVNLYKERQDPRLFRIAAPIRTWQGSETSFDAYSGLVATNTPQENSQLLNEGAGSELNTRYTRAEAEPNLALGYPEVAFTIAEAAQRGWIDADPAPYYYSAIRASMQYYGITDEEGMEAYLNQDDVRFNASSGLELILTQKYMAMFLNSGWEPFFNQRRTGIPEFDVGSGASQLNDGQVPKRWMYPQKELNTNRDNLIEALNRQYNGQDTINEMMWLIRN